MQKTKLILASSSSYRLAMLRAAGVAVEVVPASVEETAERQRMAARPVPLSPADVAIELAKLKARDVSRRFPGSLVIGSDQVLSLNGEIFSKPHDIQSARAQLTRLRGATHTLPTAVVLAVDDIVVWQHLSKAALTMRLFSDTFLDHYLERQGIGVTETVGGYKIEGLGSQLFERIEGDNFTIVGLPLLPLLEQLRQRNYLLT